MATTNTDIANMMLGRFGSKRIASFDDTTEPDMETVWCRLYLEHVRDSLLQSYIWPFAKKREKLACVGTPAFQWDYMFQLPSDYLRRISVWDDSGTTDGSTTASYEIEGDKLLWDYSTCYMRYIAKITDPDLWSPMFKQLVILSGARELVIPLSQDVKIKADLDRDIAILMPKVRAMHRAEGQKIGKDDLKNWNEARNTNIP